MTDVIDEWNNVVGEVQACLNDGSFGRHPLVWLAQLKLLPPNAVSK